MDHDYSCRVNISYHDSRGKCLRTSSVFADPGLLESIAEAADVRRKNGRVKMVLATVTFRRSINDFQTIRVEYEYAYHYSWQR